MKLTRTIKFEWNTAEKIFNGETDGEFMTNYKEPVVILDMSTRGDYPIIAKVYDGKQEIPYLFSKGGRSVGYQACEILMNVTVMEVNPGDVVEFSYEHDSLHRYIGLVNDINDFNLDVKCAIGINSTTNGISAVFLENRFKKPDVFKTVSDAGKECMYTNVERAFGVDMSKTK